MHVTIVCFLKAFLRKRNFCVAIENTIIYGRTCHWRNIPLAFARSSTRTLLLTDSASSLALIITLLSSWASPWRVFRLGLCVCVCVCVCMGRTEKRHSKSLSSQRTLASFPGGRFRHTPQFVPPKSGSPCKNVLQKVLSITFLKPFRYFFKGGV